MIMHSQSRAIDSLKKVLLEAKHDTVRFKACLAIGIHYQHKNPDTAIYYHNLATDIADKIHGPEGELSKAESTLQKGWADFLGKE